MDEVEQRGAAVVLTVVVVSSFGFGFWFLVLSFELPVLLKSLCTCFCTYLLTSRV